MPRTRVVEIRNLVRADSATHPLPRIPYEGIARDILSSSYQLSLVICGDTLAKKLNRTHRKKEYPANVLSFALDTSEGEIFLNVDAAEREAKRFGVPFRAHLMLLFAHGCLHLKGLRHGPKMEHAEQKMLKRF